MKELDFILENAGTLGVKITASMYVSDYTIVKRSWKERLFYKPWNPFIKTKSIYSPKIFRIADSYIVSFQTYSILVGKGIIS